VEPTHACVRGNLPGEIYPRRAPRAREAAGDEQRAVRVTGCNSVSATE
jgi:hypothetical protein